MPVPFDLLPGLLNDQRRTLAERALFAADFALDELDRLRRTVATMERDAGPGWRNRLEDRLQLPHDSPGRMELNRLKSLTRRRLKSAGNLLCTAASKWGVPAAALGQFVGTARIHQPTIKKVVRIVADIRIEAASRDTPAISIRQKVKKPQPPLSDTEKAVLDVIRKQPAGEGITGKGIISAMRGKLEQSTLTRHIIPKLKPHGVNNRRGVGYYVST